MTQSVDVLMPVFNNESTVATSVRSILDQTVRNLRLIVIDDGSADGTGQILAELAAGDDRLIVITTENRGIVDALNTGLGHCQAEFLGRHDGDDIAFRDRLATQIGYLADHPDCIAVSNNVWHIDANGDRIGATHGHGDAIGNLDAVPAGEPHLIHPFLMARRAYIQQVGGYRHVLNAEDADLYFRLEPLGRLHVLEERLGEYRIHTGSITSGSAQNVRVGAVYSQLAALSARRRARGDKDIEFTCALANRVRTALSLERMIEIAAEELDGKERDYLEAATAAKMLQLRVYRKFRFTWADLHTIATCLARHQKLIHRRDKVNLLKTPFWYYYRPREYLRRLLKLLRL